MISVFTNYVMSSSLYFAHLSKYCLYFNLHDDLTSSSITSFAVLGHIADQTVWLNGNLTIMFNATEGCEILNLYRNKDWVTFSQRPSNADLHTFDVPSIDERFNNATMTLRATNSSGSVLNSTEFKVYTVG